MAPSANTRNKPANTLFRQQRLAAWQPILSPPHVAGCLFAVAVLFIAIGYAILVANNNALDIEEPYGTKSACTAAENQGLFVYNISGKVTKMGCRKPIQFVITSTMKAPVYLYYKITKFYQNHRRFSKSRSDLQLAGEPGGNTDDCVPMRTPGTNTLSQQSGNAPISINGNNYSYHQLVYSPCGLVPWSMFNDTFSLYRISSAGTNELICNSSAFSRVNSQPLPPQPNVTQYVPPPGQQLAGKPMCQKAGIAWSSDKDAKFKPPMMAEYLWTGQRNAYLPDNTLPADLAPDRRSIYFPTTDNVYYQNGWYADEAGHNVPLNTDEDLMVWMRTSALPSFRKLHRIINVDLQPGTYLMDVIETYDVSSFGGEKSFALSTISWVGGKNAFLSTSYLVIGSLSGLGGIVFLVIYKLFGDRAKAAAETLNQLT